jgi:hypothetical protein
MPQGLVLVVRCLASGVLHANRSAPSLSEGCCCCCCSCCCSSCSCFCCLLLLLAGQGSSLKEEALEAGPLEGVRSLLPVHRELPPSPQRARTCSDALLRVLLPL